MTESYPTDEELEYIRTFKVTMTNLKELFEYIHNIWAYADWGWHETDGAYTISTAGWSGNEDIIRALGDNALAWSMSWYSSRKGGHYLFIIKSPGKTHLNAEDK